MNTFTLTLSDEEDNLIKGLTEQLGEKTRAKKLRIMIKEFSGLTAQNKVLINRVRDLEAALRVANSMGSRTWDDC